MRISDWSSDVCSSDLLASIRHSFPWLRHLFADGGYGGPKLRAALDKIGRWTLQIVKRSDAAKGFEVLPRRWVVERTFAWLGRCRRPAKDWEQTNASAETDRKNVMYGTDVTIRVDSRGNRIIKKKKKE